MRGGGVRAGGGETGVDGAHDPVKERAVEMLGQTITGCGRLDVRV